MAVAMWAPMGIFMLITMPGMFPNRSANIALYALLAVLTALPDTTPAAEGTIYTCPMHRQIRQVGPGNCPICGMALEPEMPSVDTGPSLAQACAFPLRLSGKV
jgi:hypothetical protein